MNFKHLAIILLLTIHSFITWESSKYAYFAIEQNVETALGVAEWPCNSDNVSDGCARTGNRLDAIEFPQRGNREHHERCVRKVSTYDSAARGESSCRVMKASSDIFNESDGSGGRRRQTDDESRWSRSHRRDVREIRCTRLPPDVVTRRQTDSKIGALDHEIGRDGDATVGYRHNRTIVSGAKDRAAGRRQDREDSCERSAFTDFSDCGIRRVHGSTVA